MKRIILTTLAVFAVITAFSQNIEQVYTRSGNIYYGYISRQPTVGTHLQFVAERQTVTIPVSQEVQISRDERDFDRLPSIMQDWLRAECGIFDGKVETGQVVTKNEAYYDVYFVSGGGNTISFMSFGRHLANIAYADVQRVARTPNPENAKEGVKTVIEMNDGMVYSGEILEQYPGVAVTFMSDDRVTRSLTYKDIAVIKYEPIDAAKPILEQVPLYDRICMKNGSYYVGVITSRNLKQGQLSLQDKFGHYAILNNSEIEALEKVQVAPEKKEEVKEEAKPLPPVLVDTCKCEFGKLTKVVESRTEKRKTYTTTRFVVTTPTEELKVVEAYDGNISVNFKTLVRASQIKIYKAEEFKAAETKWNQTTYVDYPAYTEYSYPHTAQVEYDITKSEDRTIMDITFPEGGVYIITFEGRDECVAFNLKTRRSR